MTITLATHVRELKGVGPTKAAALGRLGIKTVDDLLHHYPSGYMFAPGVSLGELQEGSQATVVGTVDLIDNCSGSAWCRTPRFHVILTVRDSRISCTWYNGSYLRSVIFRRQQLIVSGQISDGGFINPAFKVLKPGETPNPQDLNTVTYPVTSGITSKDIGRLVRQVLDTPESEMWPDPCEMEYLHRPMSQKEADYARNHFKHDELFYMQLGLAVRQARRESVPTNVQCVYTPQPILRYFPFEFTEEQLHVVNEIIADLTRPKAMNRLLQGDVGCGKTVVAAYAAIVTAFNGAQTAILCPTEILAQQHYETLKGYFERAGVKCRLVTSETVVGLHPDSLFVGDIIVGTTALLSGGVRFRNLGLVIIDEQHKFGVEQRAALRRHGNPHCLVMTATPIPRTIAMTVFGDLDISTIKTMPPGRKPVLTYWCPKPIAEAKGYREIIANELAMGSQVYVVCPRIEALDDEMRAVEEVYHEYIDLFPGVPIGRLHGRMTPAEKQEWAKWWADTSYHEGRILVSTTVVEVGVDNPNATVMVIEGAERFGLAQLHQLRGRVGRGKDQSYCFLLSDTDSAEARSRLRIMEKTNDGFEIAEHDLKMRGPGDLLSTRQHGLPDLRIADLVEDYDLMLEAREEARKIVVEDPGLQKHLVMLFELTKRFGGNLGLGDTA